MNAKIVTFSSQGDTTILEYDPATADMDEVNRVIAEYEALSVIFQFIKVDAEKPIHDQHILIRKLFNESRGRAWSRWNEETIADWAEMRADTVKTKVAGD